MRRSSVSLRVDPSLIVHKRLPWHVRKAQQRQRPWQEGKEDDGQERPKTPSVVIEIAQAVRRRKRQPQLWSNLLGQALATSAEMSPQDMANVLWSMSEVRYLHHALTDEFIRTLSFRADVKAMVTAMLAVDRLGLSVETLRAPFLRQLSGQCQNLGFGDLRRVLMSLARCSQSAPVQDELLNELCEAITAKAEHCDPRDLLAIPQHLGRLRHAHGGLLYASAVAVSTLISSRLTVLPLDVLRALDGFLLLLRIVEAPGAREQLMALAAKCRLLGAQLLQHESVQDLWSTGGMLAGAEVVELRVWIIWVTELMGRRNSDTARAEYLEQVRKRMRRQWNMPKPPEGLELALQGALRPPD